MRIKHSPLLRYLAIVLVGLLVGVLFIRIFSWTALVMNILYTLVYWEGAWVISSFSRKKYSTFEDTRKRVIFQAVGIALYVAAANFLMCGLLELIFPGEDYINLPYYLGTLKISLFITALITSIYEALNFFDLWRKAKLDAEKLKQENLLAQYETLKNQVNPHFLFNSLNTLVSIIPEDPQLAVDFVQKLSNFYRYILQYRDQDLVSLDTELEAIEAYLFLQHMRFGESLSWNIEVDNTLHNRLIPPLSIQILLENVVKHNTISRQKPLRIEIRTEGEFLLVSNPVQPKRTSEPSTRLGLANLSERLLLLGADNLVIEQTESRFTVKIPLRHP